MSIHTGGGSQIFRGGLRFLGGVSDFRGGRSQIFGGRGGLRFFGGSQIFGGERGEGGLRFSGGGGGYLVSVKGKTFDTRFGLIHVQTGKKIFVKGPPFPV